MKKSILNGNYSLLVLILLILYITYINIPNVNTNMIGGKSSNPYSDMDSERLDKILMNQSGIYKVLKNYFTIYIILVVVLLLALLYFGYIQYQILGVPVAGIEAGVGWDNEGITFFNAFFQTAKVKYGLYTPSQAPKVSSTAVSTFDAEGKALVAQAKSAVDLFCNIVAPCNICACRGPDPEYAGPPDKAPLVLYGGIDKNSIPSGKYCKPQNTVENLDSVPSAPNPAARIVNSRNKSGTTNLVLGRIPNCCCNLFDTYGISVAELPSLSDELRATPDLSAPKIREFFKKKPAPPLINNNTWPVGLPLTTGCEPTNDPTTIRLNGTQSLYGNVGYALKMFQACLSKEPQAYKQKTGDSTEPAPDNITRPNEGLTPLEKNQCECNSYSTGLDRGISVHASLTRLFNPGRLIADSRTNSATAMTVRTNLTSGIEKGKPSCKSWVRGLWNEDEGGVAPTIDVSMPINWGGPNWPCPMPTPAIRGIGLEPPNSPHPAFSSDNIETTYFYKFPIGSSRGVFFYLKINNFIHEVDAYPYRTLSRLQKVYPDCINEITETSVGGSAAIAFLKHGLTGSVTGITLNKKYISNSPRGHYIFPGLLEANKNL